MKKILTLIALFIGCVSYTFAQCYDGTIAGITPSSITDANMDGVPDDGTTIEICYTVDGWDDGGLAEQDWFHGVQVDMPASGFDLSTVTSTAFPPGEAADAYTSTLLYVGIATYDFVFEDPDMAMTGMAGTANQDFGWYTDRGLNAGSLSQCGETPLGTTAAPDGNPHNNFGLPSTGTGNTFTCPNTGNTNNVYGMPATAWTFCFTVELDCGGDCGANPPGDITFFAQGDGTTGGWENSFCTDPGTVVSFMSLIPCATSCAALDAANGCTFITTADGYANIPPTYASIATAGGEEDFPDIDASTPVSRTQCYSYTATTTIFNVGSGTSALEVGDTSGDNECGQAILRYEVFDTSCGSLASATDGGDLLYTDAMIGTEYTVCITGEVGPGTAEGDCFFAAMANSITPIQCSASSSMSFD